MTQKERELLFLDLCPRLPYGVKVTWDGIHPLTVTPHVYCAIVSENKINNLPKLLLRPMSSMTEEEKTELFQLMGNGTDIQRIDFYISHYFDFRCLIPMGLALEAPEGMYN